MVYRQSVHVFCKESSLKPTVNFSTAYTFGYLGQLSIHDVT